MSSKNNGHNESDMMDKVTRKAKNMVQRAESNMEEFGEDLVHGTQKMANQMEDTAENMATGMKKGVKKMAKQANQVAHKTSTKIGEAMDDM